MAPEGLALKIYIVTTGRAYNSEALAYQDFFQSFGHQCVIGPRNSPTLREFDVAVLFNGLNPFWHQYPRVVVEEYHSLSAGRFRQVKDLAKRVLNRRGDVKVFLNDYVREGMFYRPSEEHVRRPMGFFDTPKNGEVEKCFDIVYAGSQRSGLSEKVVGLASLGLTILMVGSFSGIQHPQITIQSPVGPKDIPGFLDSASVGLNFVPLTEPFIHQDSTKIIEYAARGLGILSNSYSWIDSFFAARGGRYLPLEEVTDVQSVRRFGFEAPSVDDLAWPVLLRESGLLRNIDRASSVNSI